jgi:hypothetical protein
VDVQTARAALRKATTALAVVADTTGKRIRLALEPEPGCAVQTIGQAVAALQGIPPGYAGLCVDTSHLAVQFETPQTLRQVAAPIVKAQISAALCGRPAELAPYAEPRFLHQTRTLTDRGVEGVDDLDQALAGALPGERRWRVHFHAPVHFGGPNTTQPETLEVIRELVGGPTPLTRHLEVETYTWQVLPEHLRPRRDADLVRVIAAELAWTRDRLIELGLREDAACPARSS